MLIQLLSFNIVRKWRTYRKMKFTFCPDCGERLIKKEIGDEGLMNYCKNCQKPIFDLFSTCIITLILNEEGQVALLRQNYISKEFYCLVAGYIKSGETAEETTFRETEEELGIKLLHTKFLKSYYYQKKDMLMLAFISKAASNEFRLSKEVDAAEWIPILQAKKLLREGSIAKQVVLDYLANLC